MSRVIISCVWIGLATAISIYVGETGFFRQKDSVASGNGFDGVERRRSAPFNVPIIVNGVVEGYVVVQLAYLVDGKRAKSISVPPEALIADATFRVLYSEQMDFDHLEKYDIGAMTRQLVSEVNDRLGVDVVKDILVEELNYVSKREVSK